MTDEYIVLLGIVMAFGIPAAILIYALIVSTWRW